MGSRRPIPIPVPGQGTWRTGHQQPAVAPLGIGDELAMVGVAHQPAEDEATIAQESD